MPYNFRVPENPATILRQNNLKDTQSRRLVLKALMHFLKPVSHKEIHQWIQQQDAATNLVTVYRTLQKFEEIGLVHRHPSSGGFVRCSLCGHDGQHGFLSCEECGKVEEFCNESICSTEEHIAKKAGFVAKQHVSDIIGVCNSCQ